MITIKQGMRIWSGITLRTEEIIILEQTKTKVAANPIPMAFLTEVETARVGHNPSTSPKVGFSIIIPLVNSLIRRFLALSRTHCRGASRSAPTDSVSPRPDPSINQRHGRVHHQD